MARVAAHIAGRVFAGLLACGTGQALARAAPPSLAPGFSIGTAGVTCEAQGVSLNGERSSVFDRKWAILCRDLAQPVGQAVVRHGTDKRPDVGCSDPQPAMLEGLSGTAVLTCLSAGSGAAMRFYAANIGNRSYRVQGFEGYDSALRLVLRSLIADRVVAGEVAVVSLGAGGEMALGEAKAAVSDADTLIGQGYRRNNAGAYAEAAELFQARPTALADPARDDPAERARQRHESTINHALQLANMGEFAQAARLFEEARALALRDPVQSRLSRNFEAIAALNRGDPQASLSILARPVPPVVVAPAGSAGTVEIDRATSAGLNSGKPGDLAGVIGQEARLTVVERAAIIDAQADAVRGTIHRLAGDQDLAQIDLRRAGDVTATIRDGRVVSIIRLRAQILSEQALSAEAQGRFGEAEGLLRQALALVEVQYPDSASVNAARARLAGFSARHGREDEALALYRAVVTGVVGTRGALVGMSNLIQPYFDLLAKQSATRPELVGDLFLASQLIERPGAADTLAQLARQLEGGQGAAAQLFRQSLALSRDIERNRIQIAQANAALANSTAPPVALADLADQQKRLLDAQARAFNQLSSFPQYRAVSRGYVTLDELRSTLRPGEAYFKLVQLGDRFYAIYAAPGMAKGWRIDKGASAIAALVSTLRDSISVTVNGVRQTFPFDVDAALALDQALLGPVRSELSTVDHLVFEPDGTMLQLPLNLLIEDPASVAAYHARATAANGDEFDFRGIGWLGRSRAISTALSASSFRDARAAPASMAKRSYLGLGENSPLGPVAMLPTSAQDSPVDLGCAWPVATWNQPIAADELRAAAVLEGRGRPELMTDAAFTDTAIQARGDLDSFRIVHFATHGLVTAPRDGCPARPALVTSFGGAGSDGLLRFDEIFNLHLDADLVILSACDTAGEASLEATRAAGIATGGGQALDGLVRAFIAAGGRQVIASHWPAPDDYGATKRLFAGFFGGSSSDSVGGALRRAQIQLMDDAQTSHPFYWAGFAIVGDGARPLHGQP